MLVKDLLNYSIPILKSSDTVLDALDLFSEFKVHDLALVENQEILALISEENLSFFNDYDLLGDVLKSQSYPSITLKIGFFDALIQIMQSGREALPVVNDLGHFEAYALKSDFLKYMVEGLSLDAQGSIIEIRLKPDKNSISEIARIIEQEHAHILSLFIFQEPEYMEKSLVLKLDSPQISYLILTLERYGFEVLSYVSTDAVMNIEKERYEMLMRYLNI
jgi:acetoin utilization protein AcuB